MSSTSDHSPLSRPSNKERPVSKAAQGEGHSGTHKVCFVEYFYSACKSQKVYRIAEALQNTTVHTTIFYLECVYV